MPCEALIKIGSNTHSHPTKEQTGCYKDGDIIEIRPLGATQAANARLECLDHFLIVQISDASLPDAYKYGQPRTEDATVGTEVDYRIITARRYFIDTAGFDLAAIRASNWLLPAIAVADIMDKALLEG